MAQALEEAPAMKASLEDQWVGRCVPKCYDRMTRAPAWYFGRAIGLYFDRDGMYHVSDGIQALCSQMPRFRERKR